MSLTRWISRGLKYGWGSSAEARKKAKKQRAREEKFRSSLWTSEGEEARRRYESYDDYLEHQSTKLERIRERVERKEEQRFKGFRERFASSPALTECRTVLCLGARLGAEVRALHDLGHFAVGLDLNPGGENPYVLPGDFHQIVFPDASVDVVYTNALDHVFDLQAVVGETFRLLKPGGVFLTDVVPGFEEGFTPGNYESHHWPTVDVLMKRIEAAAPFATSRRRDLQEVGEELWIQLEFKKPVAESGQQLSAGASG